MIDSEIAVAGPPNDPAIARASTSDVRPCASAPAAVPVTSPNRATPSALRRSKRSRKVQTAFSASPFPIGN